MQKSRITYFKHLNSKFYNSVTTYRLNWHVFSSCAKIVGSLKVANECFSNTPHHISIFITVFFTFNSIFFSWNQQFKIDIIKKAHLEGTVIHTENVNANHTRNGCA